MKAHPLAKLQLWILLIWAVTSSLAESVQLPGTNLLNLFSMVLFLILSIVTIYIGWLMIGERADIIYPFQNFGIRYMEKTRGEQAAKDLVIKYSQPEWKMTVGVMNLLPGLLCFFIAVFGVVISIQAL
jgi:hypothetical protein